MNGHEVLVVWHEVVEETSETVSGPLAEAPESRERALATFTAAYGGVEVLRMRYEQETARKESIKHRRAAQAHAAATAHKHGRRQCLGTTAKGDRCTRLAIAGRKKCQQHLGTPTLPKQQRCALRQLADLRGPSGRRK